eukprot:GHVR01006049.1.p1 GENE.GHVR01006049.1~~GHVR01006049.1.p1  ORF type:complete len:163 (-),score=25.82 GHVR01006049.1:59-547(-)
MFKEVWDCMAKEHLKESLFNGDEEQRNTTYLGALLKATEKNEMLQQDVITLGKSHQCEALIKALENKYMPHISLRKVEILEKVMTFARLDKENLKQALARMENLFGDCEKQLSEEIKILALTKTLTQEEYKLAYMVANKVENEAPTHEALLKATIILTETAH